MGEQIKKWCDAIIFNEDNLELGTYKALKMISDHARTLANQRDIAVKDHIRCCETNNKNANKLGFALVKIEKLQTALQRIEAARLPWPDEGTQSTDLSDLIQGMKEIAKETLEI